MKSKRIHKLWEWQRRAKEGGECGKCKRTLYLTVDHIIPANFLLSLNLVDENFNWEDNFQILCQACNALKGERVDLLNPKTFSLLKEAISRAEKQALTN